PGLTFDVIGAMPVGSDISILRCGPSWCRVTWNDTTGFASRKFISRSAPSYAASPASTVVAPSFAASPVAPIYGSSPSPASTVVAPDNGYGYGYGYGYAGFGGWRANNYGWWNR